MSKFDLLNESKLNSDHQSSFRDVMKKWFGPTRQTAVVLFGFFFLSVMGSFVSPTPAAAGNMTGVSSVTSVSNEYVTRAFDLKNITFEEAAVIAQDSKSESGSIYIARSVNKLIVRDRLENIMQIERRIYLRQNGLTDTRQIMIMARIEDAETGKIVATPSFSLLKGMKGKYDHFTDSGRRDETGKVEMLKTGISIQIVPVEIRKNKIDIELIADIRDIVNHRPVSHEIFKKQTAEIKKEGRIALIPENITGPKDKTTKKESQNSNKENKEKEDKSKENEKKSKKGYIFRYVLSII